MTVKSIDNLDGTETLEELEAMLDAAESGELGDEHDDTGHDETGTTEPTETDVDTAPSAAEDEEVQGDSDGNEQDEGDSHTKGIASKDGNHIIPYEVLAAERAEAKRLKDELEQYRSATEERDKLQALLEKHGIEHDAPTDVSMEQIEQLAEDYPDVGSVLVGIARKLQAMEQAAAPPPANPVLDALDAVPDLKAWQDGDPDRFTFAITVDDQLKSDPEFADKPLAERFAEAARRTKVAFGDITKVKAAEKPKDEDAIPQSPSSIGASNRHQVDGSAEQLAGLSTNELNSRMASMTSAQIDALLSSLDY